ncbi:MAG: type II secretion system protein [Phycisphaeraceae bacterium]|nr:type II secretion system protein [Phycisphaeraceae bacterium]
MNRRTRGISLIEIMASMILLASFAALAGRVWQTTLRTTRDTSDATGRIGMFELMLNQIKIDAWSAQSITINADNRVDLHWPDGQTITWQVSDDGGADRIAADEVVQHWPAADESLHFAADPAGLALSVGDDPEQQPLILVSQLRLVEGSRP